MSDEEAREMALINQARDLLDVIDFATARGITPNLGPLKDTMRAIVGQPDSPRYTIALAIGFFLLTVAGAFIIGYLTGMGATS